MLHTEPSFSIYNTNDKFDGETKNEDLIEEKLVQNKGKLDRSATVGETLEAQFSFGMNTMRMIKEDEEGGEGEGESKSSPVYVETAVGNDELGPLDGGPDESYKKIVGEDPSDPLFLKKHARFLESNGDFSGAEEFYYRATLVDPEDAEVLSRYAKLVWELHGDRARASTYFERAAQAAPEDCNVLASYASFLWEIDENDQEDNLSSSQLDETAGPIDQTATDLREERPPSPPLYLAMGLGVNMAGFGGGVSTADHIRAESNENDTVEYYRRMVEENPSHPFFLRNYAHVLHKMKGDLHGAEEYYARAVVADPSNGEILSLYADIVWQLHRDKDKAAAFFEQAVQANPEDSNVLAAYAKFLWETEEEA